MLSPLSPGTDLLLIEYIFCGLQGASKCLQPKTFTAQIFHTRLLFVVNFCEVVFIHGKYFLPEGPSTWTQMCLTSCYIHVFDWNFKDYWSHLSNECGFYLSPQYASKRMFRSAFRNNAAFRQKWLPFLITFTSVNDLPWSSDDTFQQPERQTIMYSSLWTFLSLRIRHLRFLVVLNRFLFYRRMQFWLPCRK